MNSDEIYDVLVLGYGPVGATFANLLGQAGHRVAVAEMHGEIFSQPRAINIDQEALRLWQRIDLAAAISKGCAPHTGTDFLGADGELIKAIYSAPPPYPLGWPANLMFVQPEAERQLRQRIEKNQLADVFLDYEAVEFETDTDQVALMFKTPQGTTTLRARYLIGCDGANSPTRNWLNAPQTDLGFSEHYVVVDAWLMRDTPLPPRTTQYCRPDAPTSYVICSGNLRRWELKILPDENIEDYQDLDRIKDRLRPFVDVDALKFWRSAVYHFNARVCDKWCEDRVFLAGDAAHTMPPFLGQGLNSGLRDAANLAWKLSYVLGRKADPSLLDTYQTERRPHILALTEITKELGKIVGETDAVRAAERDQRLRAEMAESGPVMVRQALIPPILDGFLDPDGGPLAGTLAPQPSVAKEGGDDSGECGECGDPELLDDLLSGFSLVQSPQADRQLDVTTDVESTNPNTFTCRQIEGLMVDTMVENQVSHLIIRPDGVIWSAGTNPTDALARLRAAITPKIPELC